MVKHTLKILLNCTPFLCNFEQYWILFLNYRVIYQFVLYFYRKGYLSDMRPFTKKVCCSLPDVFRSLDRFSSRFLKKILWENQRPSNHFMSQCTRMKFSIKVFSKCDQIRIFLRIWSHLLKKSLMENSIFCAVSLSRDEFRQGFECTSALWCLKKLYEVLIECFYCLK